MSRKPDYLFRYPLEAPGDPGSRDPLLEMVRLQLESLLRLLTLYRGGEEVKADSFRLLSEREALHPIFRKGPPPSGPAPARPSSQTGPEISYQSAANAELYEPRIPHIKRVLQSLLSAVVLESGGKPVRVDGFRLKDLGHWLAPSSGDPAEVFDHLASRCDCRCGFCYLRGNPPSLALEQPARGSEEEWEEAETRLKYFSPRGKRALFPSLGGPYEVLSHPRALDLLQGLRRKTDRPFRLSTNGNALTGDFVARLSSLAPVYLYLSLNSSSPARRRRIMGGASSETAIRSLPLLQERGIPFAAVIVPWPFPSPEEMLADLRETVAYADLHHAHLVEVSLPGHSRFFSPSPLFDLEEVWSSVVAEIRSLRPKVRTPLLVKPSLYEETAGEARFNLPAVLGVVKNSPAALAGLRPGDLILSVGGLKTASRPQARDLLRLHHQSRSPSVPLLLQRGQEDLEARLSPGSHCYPYAPATDHHLGVIFQGAGLRPSALEDLKSLAAARGAKEILFLSSRLVKPVLEQMLGESALFGGLRIRVEVPQNRFFGGNIFMGDLLVVSDFIEALREFLARNPAPDLVVLPSTPFSLGAWRRDLQGRVFTEIERAVGIPVALLDCEPIYD